MIMLKKARLIDMASKIDDIKDILISEGKFIKIDDDLELVAPLIARAKGEKLEIIDCKDMIATAGFVDSNVNFVDLKFDEKNLQEIWDIALKYGFTNIFLHPSDRNIIDNEEQVLYVMKLAKKLSANIRVFANFTKEMKGKEISDLKLLRDAKVVGFSDGYKCDVNKDLFKEVLSYARSLKMPISIHTSEKEKICKNLRENMQNLIFQDIRKKEDVEIITRYKQKGCKVIGELNPYALTYNEDTVDENTKEDIEALIRGIKDGVVEIFTSSMQFEKKDDREHFLSNELVLSLGIMKLVDSGHISMTNLLGMLNYKVAKIYNLDAGIVKEDKVADIVVIDPNKRWIYDDAYIGSKNSSFYKKELKGKVILTISNGRIKYKE